MQSTVPPAPPAVIHPLPVLSTAPSVIKPEEVDQFRDLVVIYSPTSNIFATKAQVHRTNNREEFASRKSNSTRLDDELM